MKRPINPRRLTAYVLGMTCWLPLALLCRPFVLLEEFVLEGLAYRLRQWAQETTE